MKYKIAFKSQQSEAVFTLSFFHTSRCITDIQVYKHRGDYFFEVKGSPKNPSTYTAQSPLCSHEFTFSITPHSKGCEVIIVETRPIVIVHESNLQPCNDPALDPKHSF